jgi:bifunctional non-homologous end joining protein LigD
MLVRLSKQPDRGPAQWLLVKERDDYARSRAKFDILAAAPLSAATGRSINEIADAGPGPALPAPVRSAGHHDQGRSERGSGVSGGPLTIDWQKYPKAVQRSMPDRVPPALATLVDTPPAGSRWLHEIKYDGYRLMCYVRPDGVTLVTRNGHDWSHRFSSIVRALRALPLGEAIIDGELVVFGGDGVTSFGDLQRAIADGQSQLMTLVAFDLVYYAGYDLTRLAIEDRKSILHDLLAPLSTATARVRYGDSIRGEGATVLQQAATLGVEGIVSKQSGSPYPHGRARSWLKTKCVVSDDFVVGGWTLPSGSRMGFGALLIGQFDAAGRLQYSGRVGSGFRDSDLETIHARLRSIASKSCPFADLDSRHIERGTSWVEPTTVVRVRYTGQTSDGLLRNPTWIALRGDLNAQDVRHTPVADVEESVVQTAGTSVGKKSPRPRSTATRRSSAARKPSAAPSADSPAAPLPASVVWRDLPPRERSRMLDSVANVRLSSPGKLMFPAVGATKLDLAAYYAAVADRMMPHVAHRVLALIRCPDGCEEKCFFQKHDMPGVASEVRRIPIVSVDAKNPQPETMLAVTNVEGLLGLVQFGVVEFHVWGSRVDDLERPDRLVFDLDPGEGLAWSRVVETALMMRDWLNRLELQSWVKTSGSKGLHVVVPIVRRHEWPTIKRFAAGVARQLARELPQQLTHVSSKSARRGKIYVDYLRNARGATSVAAWSLRANARAGVSMPLTWDALEHSTGSAQFHIGNSIQRLAEQKSDPWADLLQCRQNLAKKTLSQFDV